MTNSLGPTIVVLVDLVADRSTMLEAPCVVSFDGVDVFVDTLYEILVNKLCALLGRTEFGDRQDVRAILDLKDDLDRALTDAPEKDAGFSAPTLAWLLRQFPLRHIAEASGLDATEVAELDGFRQRLTQRVLDATRPPSSGPTPR